jgi:hypothetical protein
MVSPLYPSEECKYTGLSARHKTPLRSIIVAELHVIQSRICNLAKAGSLDTGLGLENRGQGQMGVSSNVS